VVEGKAMADDPLPLLASQSAAARQRRGSGGSPRGQQRQQSSKGYESPRRAVRDAIGGVGTLPPPPKSFAAMYGRRTDWREVTGL